MCLRRNLPNFENFPYIKLRGTSVQQKYLYSKLNGYGEIAR